MRRILAVIIALMAVTALCAVPMGFYCTSAYYQHCQAANVIAYSLYASDYEATARVQYQAEVDWYVFWLNPALTGEYATHDMVLFGAHDGALLAHKCTPSSGLSGPFDWTEIAAPTVTMNGLEATVTWTAPTLETGVLGEWKLLKDGVAVTLPSQPLVETLAEGTHTYALRAVLAGTPKVHQADGHVATVEAAP